ncbi:MAG: MBL fold metallo-hydrolase [Alphaproteobacteria bacterium]
MGVLNQNIDVSRPVKLADGVFWVGFADELGRLQCNPYLIVDGDEAILIDGGSRPDFSTVMRKVLQTGVAPGQISHLIYHHYDPDLCGSIPNLESLIASPSLKIISHAANNPFIRHYSVRSELLCIEKIGGSLTLRSGRRLSFHRTPYAHSAGSFITHDETSGILFTSDLFGSLPDLSRWALFAEFNGKCLHCGAEWPEPPESPCRETGTPCPWSGFHQFHRLVMPSNRALRHAMDVIKAVGALMIAPQHGSILYRAEDIEAAITQLQGMDGIGIDGIVGG